LRGDGYIHDGAYARQRGHRGISAESEWAPIERDLELAAETGCAYHICHVSTEKSVDLIRQAKKSGVDVTCETAPHYLVLCDEDMREEGRFKMNPPLRSAADREALRSGLEDGTIDMIVTDHAPHSAEEKSGGLEKSLMGVVGLETAFPVLYTALVKEGRFTLEQLVRFLHHAPRERFGVGSPLRVGEPADLTVMDLETEERVDTDTFQSLGRSTPFAGLRVWGKTKLTMVGGRIVWSDR
jgi:dihydroorotase